MQNHNCCFLNQYLFIFLPATHDRKLKMLNTLEKTVILDEFTKVRNEIRASGSECGVYHKVSAFPWGVSEGLPFSRIPGHQLYLDIPHSISILFSHNTSILASRREVFCFPQSCSLCCSLGSYSESNGF